MKITIISGSHRTNSQSEKVARHLHKTLDAHPECDKTWLFSLAGNPLPLWDQGIWDGDPAWQERMTPIREQLNSSDGFIVVTPEWHGQVPSGLKNFFLLCGKDQLGHKPALITAVSSGDGGSYPVAELRMSSYKNNRLCYLPEHLIIRKVESVLNDDPSQNDESADSYFRSRIDYSLGILLEYAKALGAVRGSGVTETQVFNNGM
jgi:NAD(P)H-dependent FMN reductase